MKKNLPISNVERDYSDMANIMSTTDLKGAISYFNDDFLAISGFDPDELLHRNHNVVRHPEMPPAAFADLWKTVKDGRPWMGIVKNRCKNGDHYWVDAYVTPIRRKGETIEYQSVRQKPRREYVDRAEALYRQLSAGKTPRVVSRSRPGVLARLLAGTAGSLLTAGALAYGLADSTLAAVAWMAGLSAVLTGAVAYLALRPLAVVVAAARRVTTDPVARYVYTGRNDEFGDILLALKSLGSETSGIVGRISDDAKRLSASAGDLSSTIGITNDSVRRQYSETDQVATAITEMAASIQEVASNAQLTAEAAENAMDEAQTGGQVVSAASASIENLAREIERASSVIADVERNSQEISTILDVIRGVSEQTNLLALNAAIEAARAGEQGRGFAVVADEVRTLAARTNDSTAQIQSMIETLQAGTQEAVAVMETSRGQAMTSVEQATSAARSIEAITGAVERIKDMSVTIASAVEEQSAVSEEINRSVTSIRDTAEQTMEASRNTAEASTAMAGLATGMSDLANEFWEKKSKR